MKAQLSVMSNGDYVAITLQTCEHTIKGKTNGIMLIGCDPIGKPPPTVAG